MSDGQVRYAQYAQYAIDGVDACGLCDRPLLKRRFVWVDASSLFYLCSRDCLRTVTREQSRRRWAARRQHAKSLTVGVIFVGACLTPHQGPPSARRAPRAASLVQLVKKQEPPPLPEGWFGPDWPPLDSTALAALGRDAWIHPLPGPVRRMPLRDSRVFGAVRPGDRAVECRNGHCGVDLGGEIWGEQVHAVHDGVVDRVKRGVNPERGGQFVRLAHRNGTVFTQYFHLAAIPRGLERGVHVRAGDIVGLLGDTGVKESEPHLHFTVSVRPSKEGPEKYIDPEPLIALWPLRVPVDGTEVGLVTTVASPGTPLGSAPLMRGRKLKLLKKGKGRSAGGLRSDDVDGAAAAPPPAADEEAGSGGETSEPATED